MKVLRSLPARMPAAVHALLRRAARVTAATAEPRGDYLQRWLHAALLDVPRDAAVLAVGGEELPAGRLAEYSADVTVLDTSIADLAPRARQFPDIAFLHHRPDSPLPFARDTFEAVWCCGLLDHLADPAGALREMHRVLAPAGRLLVAVPDRGPVHKLLTTLFRCETRLARWSPGARAFTRLALARLIREAGFDRIHTGRATFGAATGQGAARRWLVLKARKSLAVQVAHATEPEPLPVNPRPPLPAVLAPRRPVT